VTGGDGVKEDDLVSIGRLAGTFGVRGSLKMVALTDFPERFHSMQRVILNQGGRLQTLTIESVQPHQQQFLIKFEGVDNKEEARLLVNALLQVEEKDVHPLPEGVYYHFQLIGLQVFDRERGLLGEISDILETGANDVYVVQSPRYGEVLLPSTEEVVLDIDLDKGRVDVDLLPGLIED
jgi:16S rRNA processing protein RimM